MDTLVDFSLLCISTSYTVPLKVQAAAQDLSCLSKAWSGVFQQREALCASLPIALNSHMLFFSGGGRGIGDEILLRSQWHPPASVSYS